MDERRSICELIDCSILFYYAVAHKYVVMVRILFDQSIRKYSTIYLSQIADLRDNIAHLSDILIETKNNCDDVLKKLEELNSCANGKDGNSFQSTHDEILDELNEKFGQRKNIFAVSNFGVIT
jgi:Kip1 ubiquitination-promoting complex protein 1